MSYSASFRPNMVVPFHRWTNCGPRQLHTEFGPNIRTTSIPAAPLTFNFIFSRFIIQNCAMSYSASFRPNMVVPFHRWTNCGPRQLHTKFGPNIRTTSIPAGPLLLMFSYFNIQNFRLYNSTPPPLRGPLNKIENR